MTYLERLEKHNKTMCGNVGLGIGLGAGTKEDSLDLEENQTEEVDLDKLDEDDPLFDLFTPQIMKLKREFNERERKRKFMNKNCKFINKAKIQ